MDVVIGLSIRACRGLEVKEGGGGFSVLEQLHGSLHVARNWGR